MQKDYTAIKHNISHMLPVLDISNMNSVKGNDAMLMIWLWAWWPTLERGNTLEGRLGAFIAEIAPMARSSGCFYTLFLFPSSIMAAHTGGISLSSNLNFNNKATLTMPQLSAKEVVYKTRIPTWLQQTDLIDLWVTASNNSIAQQVILLLWRHAGG